MGNLCWPCLALLPYASVLHGTSIFGMGLDVVAKDDAFFHKDKYFQSCE